MTLEFGFGMLVMGLIAITIGATIAYFIINKVSKEDKENEEYLKELKDKRKGIIRGKNRR